MSIRRLFGWALGLIVALALLFTHTVTVNIGQPQSVASTVLHPAQFAALPAISTGSGMDAQRVYAQVGPAVVTVINSQLSTRRSGGSGGSGGGRGQRPGSGSGSGNATSPGSSNVPVDTGLGSGVIFDNQGDILTNNHVVSGASAVSVVLQDGTRLDATLIGRDPSQDVAVVRIDPSKAPAIATLGDSSTVQPGEPVLAIGSPEELANTVTSGIVSATNRQVDTYVGLIQTDTAVNPGNSGGPLVNAQGQVIGLNTLGLASQGDQGLNFAIPINTAKQVAQTLTSKGNGAVVTTRAYLGVGTQTLDSAVAQQVGVKDTQGAYVSQVQSGTPADQAGLQKGDVITAVNGTQLNGQTTLGTVLSGLKPGDTVTLTVDRNGETQTLTATLAERPANA